MRGSTGGKLTWTVIEAVLITSLLLMLLTSIGTGPNVSPRSLIRCSKKPV